MSDCKKKCKDDCKCSKCCKNGQDGQDGRDGCDGPQGEKGERGKRGHRGHHGPIGFPGPTGAAGITGPTGPCCTGPTGATGTAPPCESLYAFVFAETCTDADPDTWTDLMCVPFNITNPTGGGVDIFVSLSAALTAAGEPAVGSVIYRVTIDSGSGPVPIPTGQAASRAPATGNPELPQNLEGNAFVLHQELVAGSYTVCVQWRVELEGQIACIDPEGVGQHGSLLVQSCAGLTAPVT